MGRFIPPMLLPIDSPLRVNKTMPRIKKTAPEIQPEAVVETTPETVVSTEPVVESVEKAAFRKLIADYKIANPVKYEMKKEALEAQLEAMK
jgi:hypothetical protein